MSTAQKIYFFLSIPYVLYVRCNERRERWQREDDGGARVARPCTIASNLVAVELHPLTPPHRSYEEEVEDEEVLTSEPTSVRLT